jgi:hypothetical protein
MSQALQDLDAVLAREYGLDSKDGPQGTAGGGDLGIQESMEDAGE